MAQDAAAAVEAVYRADWGRIVAALIRIVGDFDLAEEASQEAFTAAADQWRASGVPEFPRAWIIQTARHKAIDRLRRQARFAEKMALYATSESGRETEQPDYLANEIPDDRLRLIFTCCHPALALEAQVALTLARSAASTPTRLHGRFSCLLRRWRSGSSEPSARFATRPFLTPCPARAIYPSGSTPS